ncbi:MAG: hypothetical protein FJ318_00095 [SAR202 cluster bacterium]|nr:hypothetical protein [SAR202 cluster bacterium]
MLATPLLWLVVVELLAIVAFPLAFRAFSRLPDRGWAFSKPLGVLLTAYIAWLIGLTRLVESSRWTAFAAACLVIALSVLAMQTGRATIDEIRAFIRERWRTIAATEIVFIAAFALVVLLRANVPAITHTEQPMDFLFLNAAVTSPHYPPNDPWLAGHPVSYYYFGYVIVGTVTMLTNTATPVAYNLGLALAAALAAVGVFGLVGNLVRLARGSEAAAMVAGVGGVWLLLVASNAVGALELVRAAGAGTERFWSGVGIDGLTAPSGPANEWYPGEVWWWWRATRVIPGTINEFPAFSFLLGDLHPHVMSIGFLVLAAGVATQAYLQPRLLAWASARASWPLLAVAAVSVGALAAINLWDFPVALLLVAGALLLNAARHGRQVQWRLARALVLSALLFGVSLVLFASFYATFDAQAKGMLRLTDISSRPLHLAVVWGLPGLLALGLLAAASPAAFAVRPHAMRLGIAAAIGFAPALLWLQPLWGAVLYLIAIAFFILHQAGYRMRRFDEMSVGTGTAVLAWIVGAAVAGVVLIQGLATADGDGFGALTRLQVVVPMGMVVSAAIFTAWSLAKGAGEPASSPFGAEAREAEQLAPADGAVPALGVLAVGALLIMGAELFWVVDGFGGVNAAVFQTRGINGWLTLLWGLLTDSGVRDAVGGLMSGTNPDGGPLGGLRRMNTVFKLYYQAWTLLAVVGGFAAWYVCSRCSFRTLSGRAGFVAWSALLALGAGALGYYALAGAESRYSESNAALTLDGQAHVWSSAAPEAEAIAWIRGNAPRDAVVVEAAVVRCGDASGFCSDWTDAGRIASSTGRPTILGWEPHERQWRDGSLVEGRAEDVRVLYSTNDHATAAELLRRYRVRYVVIGPRERSSYGTDGVGKWEALGTRVFGAGEGTSGEVLIYDVGAAT